MPLQVVRATKKAAKFRLGLGGPAGSGKTYTALAIARALFEPEEIGVIDTENGSAAKYADIFGEFLHVPMDNFDPRQYVEAITLLYREQVKIILIDSLSHAWAGKGGALELKDKAAERNGGNSYTAWSKVTPLQNRLLEAIIRVPCHVIATFRAKQDYVQELNERGKTVIRRLGMAPIQRDGMEYEFDVFGMLDADNVLSVVKTRCPILKGAEIVEPGAELARTLIHWVSAPIALEAADGTARPSSNVVRLNGRLGPTALTAASSECEQASDEFIEAMATDPSDAALLDDLAAGLNDEAESGPRDEPAGPGWQHKCAVRECPETWNDDTEIVFGGGRFWGRVLTERGLAEAHVKLCAPHLKQYTEGVDVMGGEAIPG